MGNRNINDRFRITNNIKHEMKIVQKDHKITKFIIFIKYTELCIRSIVMRGNTGKICKFS